MTLQQQTHNFKKFRNKGLNKVDIKRQIDLIILKEYP